MGGQVEPGPGGEKVEWIRRRIRPVHTVRRAKVGDNGYCPLKREEDRTEVNRGTKKDQRQVGTSGGRERRNDTVPAEIIINVSQHNFAPTCYMQHTGDSNECR